jgi:hypothetical protein
LGAILLSSGLLLASSAQAPDHEFPPPGMIPAYHAVPPKSSVAATLSPREFPNDPLTERCYAAAGQIKAVLYQLPCYCHCDREMGHSSLLNCFQDRHAAECATCKMELYFAWEESRKGKSARQIRQEIIRGDWQKVNLSEWTKPIPAKPASKP